MRKPLKASSITRWRKQMSCRSLHGEAKGSEKSDPPCHRSSYGPPPSIRGGRFMVRYRSTFLLFAAAVAMLILIAAKHPRAQERPALSDGFSCPLDPALTCVMKDLDNP